MVPLLKCEGREEQLFSVEHVSHLSVGLWDESKAVERGGCDSVYPLTSLGV